MRLIAFFLMETFKEDVGRSVIKLSSYATRVRPRLIDFAAKIVRTGGRIILKVTKSAYTSLRLNVLWERAYSPPRFTWR